MSEESEPLDEELEALRSVSHGAVLSVGGVSLQKVLLFLTNLALTASLSVGLYGVYALGNRIAKILLQFGGVGANAALVRFLPEYRGDRARQNRVLGIAYGTAAVASVAIGAGVFLLAGRINAATIAHPAFPPVLRLFAVLFPFDVFTRLLAFVFRALEEPRYQVFITRIVRPGARLVAIGIALLLGFSVTGIVGALVVATAVAAGIALWLSLSRTDLRPSFRPSREEAAEFYNHSGPNTLSRFGKLFQSRIDVLLIGFLLTADAAGIYNLSLFLTSIIAIPLIAFNQLLPPIASKLYADGKHATLNAVYGTVTRLIVTATLALAVAFFVYRTQLLALFGGEYTRGSLVFATFVIGRIVGNGVGATGWLLLMTDHQYLRMVNSWVLGALNVAASYYFILEFGLVGAALGTAGSMALINLVRLSQLWYLEGLQPYDRKFLKPVAAGVAMAVTATALKLVLSGVALLVVGTLVGLAAFGGTLFLLGIERRDRRLVGVLIAQYRPGSEAPPPSAAD
ncbi:MAG: oligosaccharide flippase family protein [Halobacteriales archaeon]